jgi:2'-5' RNA ligase
MRSHRLFYALWPDDRTRHALMELQAPLQGRKVRFANLHLTLAFLGQQPHETLAALKGVLADLRRISIPLAIDRIGYFTRSKIAWAGMHETPPQLISLQREVAVALAKRQITLDGAAAFRPHITLARDAPPPEDLPFTPFTWKATQVALVESTNQADGVHYRVLTAQEIYDSDVSGGNLPNEMS